MDIKNNLKVKKVKNKMKTLINIKTGYSSGAYGCSAEYFTLMAFNDNNLVLSIDYKGLYGSEHRIMEVLENAGYKIVVNTTGVYGKVTGSDKNYSKTEKEAIEYIKQWLKDNA